MSKVIWYGQLNDTFMYRFVAESKELLLAAMAAKAKEIMQEENTWNIDFDDSPAQEILMHYENDSECGEHDIEDLDLIESNFPTTCCAEVLKGEMTGEVAAASARLILMALAKAKG